MHNNIVCYSCAINNKIKEQKQKQKAKAKAKAKEAIK